MLNNFERLRRWLDPWVPNGSTELATHSSQLMASLLTMAWFVEARDPYTGGHLWRVSRYAYLLAERAGLRDGEAARIGLGGFLHDLGKVGVPDAVLRKNAGLTDEEYAIIKTHPHMGARMLAGHPLAQLVNDAVLLHHERADGEGYPLGLAGDSIPEMARIVGICDAFDAMTSHRPYRPGMPRDAALAIITEHSGTQFDRRYARIFFDLGAAGQLDHIIGYSDNGIPLECCPMCGPTVVILSRHKKGDHVYCRNCSSEFHLTEGKSGLAAVPTGRQGSAADLEPETDTALIARTVREAVAAMPIADLLT